MDHIDLKKQSQELEQTLNKQLELLKNDSGIYVKVAGATLAAGLLGYGLVRLTRKPTPAKPKKKKKGKKKKKKGNSLMGNIRQRLFWLLMDFLKQRFMSYMTTKMQPSNEKGR
jgi:hypothetical protein